jgi:glycosyltransferase involved in cell wall biosynthesis
MNKPLISILVPFFNSESHIEDCLNSILQQSYKYFECICINDGSTDNSREIVSRFAKYHARIKLIDQKNCGVATARNTALNNSKGDYICFVDSDDIIHPKKLEILLNTVIKFKVDYVSCKYQIVDGNKKYDSLGFEQYQKATIENVSKNPLYDALNGNLTFMVSPCVHLYRKELLSNLQYDPELKIHEDTFGALKILQQSKSAVAINEVLYFYKQTNDSLTRSGSYEMSLNNLTSISIYAKKYVEKWKIPEKLERSYYSKAGVAHFNGILIDLVLNRGLPKKERKKLWVLAKNLRNKLKNERVYNQHDLPIFIKVGLFISYSIKMPRTFRFLYSKIWYKRWTQK